MGTWNIKDRRSRFAVAGETLPAIVEPPSESLGRLAGFAPATGRHLGTSDRWRIKTPVVHHGEVISVCHTEHESGLSGEAYVIDPVQGTDVAVRRLQVPKAEPYTLHVHGNRLLYVDDKRIPGTPPVRAYDWR